MTTFIITVYCIACYGFMIGCDHRVKAPTLIIILAPVVAPYLFGVWLADITFNYK